MMLSTLTSDDWGRRDDPFPGFKNLEAEIAELRTMTRVTRLRQKIECRQEGSWLVTGNIKDATSGVVRKVTSYGRASSTRSFSHDDNFKAFVNSFKRPDEVIVEFPDDNDNNSGGNTIEITELDDSAETTSHDNSSRSSESNGLTPNSVRDLSPGRIISLNSRDPSPAKSVTSLFEPVTTSTPSQDLAFTGRSPMTNGISNHSEDLTYLSEESTVHHDNTDKVAFTPEINLTPSDREPSPGRKTSVVTLGDGNIVVIDPEKESNFHVTAVSRGIVAHAVRSFENALAESEKPDRKSKKVGFCKTEVHFSPDTGRFNIVETDEKPPPQQMYRRKKRPKERAPWSNLPKVYFGDMPDPEPANFEDEEVVSPSDDVNIRSESPLKTDLDHERSSKFNVSVANSSTPTDRMFPTPSPEITSEKKVNTTKVTLNNHMEESRDPTPNHSPLNNRIVVKLENKLKNEATRELDYLGNVSPKLLNLIQNSDNIDLSSTRIIKNIVNQQQNLLSKNGLAGSKQTSPSTVSIKLGVSSPVLIDKKPVLAPDQKVVVKPSPVKPLNVDLNVEPRAPDREKRVACSKTIVGKPDSFSRKEFLPRTSRVVSSSPIKGVPMVSTRRTHGIKSKSEGIQVSSKSKIQVKSDQKDSLHRPLRKKEPLRSFEKVSNGWTGHCIVPITVESKESKRKDAMAPAKSAHISEMSRMDEMTDMTASYSEICDDLDDDEAQHLLPHDDFEDPNRPSSLVQLSRETSRAMEALSMLDGTVTRDEAGLISFVADDIETKIKMSSPQGPGPDSLVPLGLLNELENHTSVLASSVDSLTENLAAVLQGISALTVGCVETYRDSVCKTCDAVDSNIKSTYQLMAKCEELHKAMLPIGHLHAKIKSIKTLLDRLESTGL